MKLIAKVYLQLILAFITTCLLPSWVAAQETVVERWEIELKEEDELPRIIPLGEKGFLYLTQTSDKVGKQQVRWRIFQSDTSLAKRWEETYLLSNNLYYKDHFIAGDEIYLLFAQSGNNDFTICQLNYLEGGDIEVSNIYSPISFDLQTFKVFEDDVYMGGELEGKPVLMHYSLMEKRTKILPTVLSQTASIDDIYLDYEAGVVRISMSYTRRRKSFVHIKTFLPGGVLAKDYRLIAPKDKELLSAKLINNGPEGYLAVGTFSNRLNEMPQGMYITSVEGDEQVFTKLHHFTEYHNLFNHLKPSHKERMIRKVFKRKEKGKDLKLRYNLLQHDIIVVDDQLLVVAEAYYPQYRSESIAGYPLNGVQSGRIFEGYKFTHALLCAFDRQGNAVWNNSINMNEVLSRELSSNAHTYCLDNKIGVAFLGDKTIQGLMLEKGEVNPDVMTISLKKPDEKLKAAEAPEDLKFNHWFNKSFMLTGTQTFFPSKDRSKRKTVFFIQKVAGYQEVKQNGHTSIKTRR